MIYLNAPQAVVTIYRARDILFRAVVPGYW